MEMLLANFRQIGKRLQQFWNGLTLNQKVIGAGAILFMLIPLMLWVMGRGSAQTLEVLYADLDQKDAAAVVQKLDEQKVPYRLEDNGTTILVPTDLKYTTRLKLAAENLPRGQAGLELFRESSFGETQTDKKVKYQEALQGELARTIQALDKVKAANVMLALPEKSLFSDNEEPVKASVVIRTADGQVLTPREVQGIINLVSNSVERLIPENVVIVDQYGNLVSDNLPSSADNITSQVEAQMLMKKSFEKEKEKAIQTMLDKTLGQDNSVVRVNADLVFDSKEQRDERYFHDDKGPFIRSEEISKDSGTQANPVAEGLPGTDTNIPQYLEAAPDGGSSYDKSTVARNYELNRTETVTKFSPGDVDYEYLTVSVLVNRSSSQQESLGDTEEERIDKIRSIVATACGLRENRANENVSLQDNISVAFIDFYTEPIPEPRPATITDQLLKSPLTPVVISLLALTVIVLMLILLRRRSGDQEELSEFESVVEEEIRLEDLIDKSLSPEERERQRIRQEIDRLIDDNPEDAAQVIRTWLAEDSR